jgi:hypothetical protein
MLFFRKVCRNRFCLYIARNIKMGKTHDCLSLKFNLFLPAMLHLKSTLLRLQLLIDEFVSIRRIEGYFLQAYLQIEAVV